MEWDPKQYGKFTEAREAPFADVIALVRADPRMRVVDLGCGPGALTRKLADRFADAEIVGIDSPAGGTTWRRWTSPNTRSSYTRRDWPIRWCSKRSTRTCWRMPMQSWNGPGAPRCYRIWSACRRRSTCLIWKRYASV